MRKHIFTLLLFIAVSFSGCSSKESVQSISETESVQRKTELYIPVSEEDTYESSVSEEMSAVEVMAKYDAVTDTLVERLNNDEFLNADDEKKAEMVIEVLTDLATNGTKEYPYPLVIRDSWQYLPKTREVEFEFFNGVRSTFVLRDENDPYDQEQTDIIC